MSETQTNLLNNIANSGYAARTYARSLLSLLEDNVYYASTSQFKPIRIQPDEDLPSTQFWSIFPNPAKDQISIHFADEQLVSEVVIYDHLGRMIQQTNLDRTQTRHVVSLAKLEKGLYILHLYEKGQRIGSRKFLKMDE